MTTAKQLKMITPEIKANQCMYIKLGEKGCYEDQCIKDNVIRLSYIEFDHESCMKGDWDKVFEVCKENSKSPSAARTHLNQLKHFYEADENTLWFTFHKGKMYWCFADTKVKLLEDGTKIRKCISDWSCKDINGNELSISSLSGKLTKTQGYRQTICETKVKKYLINRINGRQPRDVVIAKQLLSDLENKIARLICELDPKDFELLVELVFTNTGWVRIGEAGGHIKDIDLRLISPFTKEKIGVQIKSSTNNSILQDYVERIKGWDFDQFYFIYHSGKVDHKSICNDKSVKIIDAKTLSNLIIDAGLTSWVLEKAS